MKYTEFKELFTGRRNIFTVLMVSVGAYMIVYPTTQYVYKTLGPLKTIAIGFILLILGDLLLDAFHEKLHGKHKH